MARDFGHDDAARAGKRFDARRADPYADAEDSMSPVDIMAVRRDDALIDAIAGDGPVATDSAGEYQLASLLAEWRSDLMAAPMPESPDLDEVAAAVEAVIAADTLHRRRTRNRLRLLRPVAGAAAAVAFVIGGLTAFSYSAMPGDPLWKVKEVVFTQQADSTVAKVDTTTALEDVEAALARGDAQSATTLLAEAAQRAPSVRDEGERARLEEWWTRLNTALQQLTAPLPVAPAPAETATTATTPVVPTLPNELVPDAPVVPDLPLPNIPIPTDLQLPTNIPLPQLQWPTDLLFPTTVAPTTVPPNILRLPLAPETTPTVSVPIVPSALVPN